MRIKQHEWNGGELCSLLHRKNFLEAFYAMLERENRARKREELRILASIMRSSRSCNWVHLLISQAGEDWITSFLGNHLRGSGLWAQVKRGNGSQAIEYQIKEKNNE